MNIPKPDRHKVMDLFKGFEELTPRDKAFRIVDIMNFFHQYYMEKIEIILAIAGEMQKHFKETK